MLPYGCLKDLTPRSYTRNESSNPLYCSRKDACSSISGTRRGRGCQKERPHRRRRRTTRGLAPLAARGRGVGGDLSTSVAWAGLTVRMGSTAAMLLGMQISYTHPNSGPRATDAARRGSLRGVSGESEDVTVGHGDEPAMCVMDLAVSSPAQS